MPQMSPLMWMPLFVLFSLVMSLVMTKIYFNNSSKKKETSNQSVDLNTNLNNWKW